MKDLLVKKTYHTPQVNFCVKTGIFSIEGRSIPENPVVFYEPLIKWLQEYFKAPHELTQINIKLDYINSGSSKALLTMLKVVKPFFDKGIHCHINWHFEEDDESIRDLGKHFQAALHMPFNLVELF